MNAPTLGSLPPGWRDAALSLPAPTLWREIAESDNHSGIRERFSSAYPALQAVANLADSQGIRQSYESLRLRRGQRLLDAACGPAISSRIASDLGLVVTAVDNDPKMLDVARRGPGAHSVSLIRADLRQPLPWPDNHFDYVVVGDWWDEAFLPELLRILAPDGQLWVRMSNLTPPTLYPADRAFDSRMWQALSSGYVDQFGDTGESTRAGLHRAGFRLSHETALRHDWRRPIVGFRFALSFVLWESRFLRNHLGSDDWARALEYWDPTSSPAWWTTPQDGAITHLSHWRWQAG